MDAVNPITGIGYRSQSDFKAVAKWFPTLTGDQVDYLRMLSRARKLEPDAALEAEPVEAISPAAATLLDEELEKAPKCAHGPIPRRGGHKRHDDYATQVTGSPRDYWVLPPSFFLGIAYDGLGPLLRVWEVKVGFGWFFNPAKKSLTDITLARFDAQKNRGLAAAGACRFTHLWAIPDPHVALLLNTRWGGNPPVLAIPELKAAPPSGRAN
jgi:hypothetical protein